ncbi:MAG: penicillin-binding protein family [Gemmatimonadetes bacterium]|nr:penicillin-binding protein family [Gemmatimonadota bacterium]
MASTRTSSKRPAQRNGPPPRKTRGRGASIFRALLVLFAVGLVVGGGVLAWLWPRCSGSECPDVAALRTYTPPQASTLYDRDGKLVASLAPERRIVVPLARIPAHVSGAFLSVEDKRFYRHRGVDWRRAAGALARDVRHLRYDQGFSTVTMQLARNVFPQHLNRAKTLRRKLWEIVLARRIEAEFSKEQILEMYLNQIYLGEGLYGVEAAARGYFGKPAAQLTVGEAALLAALPRAPSYYTPRRNPTAALQRRNVVLGLMAEAGVVSAADAAAAKQEPLHLAPPAEAAGAAPYFIQAVRQELQEHFGAEAATAGLRVYTTLDRGLQAAAELELRRQITAVELGAFGRFRHPSCARGGVPADQCLQGLFVALDPRTGDVMALVGGRDYALSQFDRARQARRQAGSAFKPIVYAAALGMGLPITTPLVGPGVQDTVESTYRPADHVADSVTLDMRSGLALSSNRAAVAVGEKAGAGRVVELAHAMGLSTPIQPFPSTFLGAADVIPLEMVASYAAFTNGGTAVAPRLIQRVTDAQGHVVYEGATRRRYVLSPSVAFLTTSLMREVVDRGTGTGVRTAGGLPYSIPAAGKTGTTNAAADVWFVGVTPDLVAGVWMGFDRPQAILLSASGGGIAAPVWGRVLASYYRTHPAPPPWVAPADVVTRQIDGGTGYLATPMCPGSQVREEFYASGTEPKDYCPLHPADGALPGDSSDTGDGGGSGGGVISGAINGLRGLFGGGGDGSADAGQDAGVPGPPKPGKASGRPAPRPQAPPPPPKEP